MKFEIFYQSVRNACTLSIKTNRYIISFGYHQDILLYKQNNKTESYCSYNPKNYNYHGVINPFIEDMSNRKNQFTPKRIFVLQMKYVSQ